MRALGWMISILALSCPGAGLAQGYEATHDCDTYAAHPDDPNRWAKGVIDEDIIPGPAVKFCREAVKKHDDTPRFQFQLGRALWAAHRFEEGTETFLTLEENFDYDPVYAYLGDAFYYGIGGVEVDEELAVQLYEVAADSGFIDPDEGFIEYDTAAPAPVPVAQATNTPQPAPPVEEALAAIAAEPVIPAPVKVDFASFSQPKALRALESGNLAALKKAGLGEAQMMGMRYSKLNIYLAGFNGQFAGEYNFKDPSCIAIYSPRASKQLERAAMMTATGGGTMQGAAEASLGMILGTMQQMQSGNMMGMVDQSQALELLREEGAKDGAKLILSYGCQSEVVKRMYANLVAHVTGSNPVLSGAYAQEAQAERKRQQEQQRLEAEARARKKEQERQKALRTKARTSCEVQFSKSAFCGCVVKKFDAAGLKEDAWSALGKEFKAVLSLRDTYPDVPSIIADCRKSNSN